MQFAGIAFCVVDSVNESPLKSNSAIFLVKIFATRLHEVFNGVALVDRNKFIAQIIAGRMK